LFSQQFHPSPQTHPHSRVVATNKAYNFYFKSLDTKELEKNKLVAISVGKNLDFFWNKSKNFDQIDFFQRSQQSHKK